MLTSDVSKTPPGRVFTWEVKRLIIREPLEQCDLTNFPPKFDIIKEQFFLGCSFTFFAYLSSEFKLYWRALGRLFDPFCKSLSYITPC